MDAEVAHSEQLYRLLDWFERNRGLAVGIVVIVLVAAVAVAYFVWQGDQKQISAAESLSSMLSSPPPPGAEDLLNFATEHEGTSAGSRASFLAAGELFTEGQYDVARQQFEQFIAANPGSPLVPQARLGIAASHEALGNTEDAVATYEGIASGPDSGGVGSIARFALGLIYEEQGFVEAARDQYEALAADPQSSLAREASARLDELPAPAVEAEIESSTDPSAPSAPTNTLPAEP